MRYSEIFGWQQTVETFLIASGIAVALTAFGVPLLTVKAGMTTGNIIAIAIIGIVDLIWLIYAGCSIYPLFFKYRKLAKAKGKDVMATIVGVNKKPFGGNVVAEVTIGDQKETVELHGFFSLGYVKTHNIGARVPSKLFDNRMLVAIDPRALR